MFLIRAKEMVFGRIKRLRKLNEAFVAEETSKLVIAAAKEAPSISGPEQETIEQRI